MKTTVCANLLMYYSKSINKCSQKIIVKMDSEEQQDIQYIMSLRMALKNAYRGSPLK